MKWPNAEAWKLIFDGMQGISAAIAVALALWGVLFTDLPEIIIRQLRTDISDAHEEMVGLRIERNRALSEILVFASERDAATKEIADKQIELAQANNRLMVLSSEVEAKETVLISTQRELDGARLALTEVQEREQQARSEYIKIYN